jgi:hypothetical protein
MGQCKKDVKHVVEIRRESYTNMQNIVSNTVKHMKMCKNIVKIFKKSKKIYRKMLQNMNQCKKDVKHVVEISGESYITRKNAQ